VFYPPELSGFTVNHMKFFAQIISLISLVFVSCSAPETRTSKAGEVIHVLFGETQTLSGTVKQKGANPTLVFQPDQKVRITHPSSESYKGVSLKEPVRSAMLESTDSELMEKLVKLKDKKVVLNITPSEARPVVFGPINFYVNKIVKD